MSSGNALISSLSTFFSFLFECLKQEGVSRNVLSTVLLLNSVASYCIYLNFIFEGMERERYGRS